MSDDIFTDQMREYLLGHREGVLATAMRDGRPQQTLIGYWLHNGQILVSTRASSQKAKNLNRRPKVSLAVIDNGQQAIVYATARVATEEAEVFALHRVRNARRPENDEELAERLKREERVVLVLTPEKVYPDVLRAPAVA
jgi:PPOX class probable F420-dependent enzyme